MSLTAREEKFCQEYVKLLDKAKAAVAAGYSKKTAKDNWLSKLYKTSHSTTD
jgi:phage terminase small subunit